MRTRTAKSVTLACSRGLSAQARAQTMSIAALLVLLLLVLQPALSEQDAAQSHPPSPAGHMLPVQLRTLAANGPEPHVLILTTASCVYQAMLINFWLSWERLGRSGQVLIVAEDKCIHNFITQELGPLHVVPALRKYDELPQEVSGDFNSPNFNSMCRRRLAYILHALHLGVPVLFQDLDSVFLQEPFKFLPRPEHQGLDLVLTHDGNVPYPASMDGQPGELHACACLMLISPTWGAIKFMRMWMARVATRGDTHDQTSLQEVLRECNLPDCHLRSLVMPSNLFPSGAVYDSLPKPERTRVSWVHANYRVGTHAKVEFLKQAGVWALREPPPPPSPPPPPPLPPSPPSESTPVAP